LYYTRNSYEVTLISGDYIVSVSGSGTYKYGQEVKINAQLSEESGVDFEFINWQGNTTDIDDREFNKKKVSTSFVMPAKNISLTANAKKVDVTLSEPIILGFEGQSEKKLYPEPGDWIEYKVVVKNTEDTSSNITLELLIEEGKLLESNIDLDSIKLNPGEEKEITFKIAIDQNFPVGKKFAVTMDAVSTNGKAVESTIAKESIEKVSAVNFKEKKDKNIIMLIDLSGSMGFCTAHPQLATAGYYGDDTRWKDIKDDSTIDPGVGSYDEGMDLIFDNDGNGGYEMRLNYDKLTTEPWKNHSIDNTDPNNICREESRIDVLIEALAGENGFVDKIAKGAKQNGEKVTISLVTFSGYFDNVAANGSMAEIVGVYELADNNDTLKARIKKLELDIHDGTALNTGLNKVVDLTSDNSAMSGELLSGDNVENYFIFFGDGAAADNSESDITLRKQLINTLIKNANAYFDYSYAIGFGSDFKNNVKNAKDVLKSMLKGTGSNEPITAENADDVIKAFESIALSISSVNQSSEGELVISGPSFDDAVANNKVFKIGVMDGNDELFVINSTSDTEITWKNNGKDVKTIIKFNKTGDKLTSIAIDLSGTDFSDKSGLNVIFNYNK